jgi:sialate O-acetylesterase
MQIERGLSDGHFLQRRREGTQAAIAGSCSTEGPIIATVRCGSNALPQYQKRKIGSARNGRFQAVLAGLPAGGPYDVRLECGRDGVELQDVFVGDLWLMAGQSNMEGCAVMTDVPEPHPMVRCFTMARRWEIARDPLHLKLESPDPVHGGKSLTPAAAERLRRSVKHGAGLGVPFGRLMYEQTGVPQGLIATAHGGSNMMQWDPALRKLEGRSLYGSMWLSLQAAGQPLAGVLWFQGESEALPDLARVYTRRMLHLVSSLRRDLGQPKLPWLLIQIGRFIKGGAFERTVWPDPISWNSIQEQQRVLPQAASNCAIVPSIDLELDDLAHIASRGFSILASRLAKVALPFVSGGDKIRQEINPKSIRFKPACSPYGPRIHIDFTGVVGDLHSVGPVGDFTLLRANGRPFTAIHRVGITRNRVILHLTAVPPRGARLSYGYGLAPSCTLVDGRGMAVPVFGPLPISELAATASRVSKAKPTLGKLPTVKKTRINTTIATRPIRASFGTRARGS